MIWRRGMFLAGIHLAIAVPLIVVDEVPSWNMLKGANSTGAGSVRLVALQEDGVDFNPCQVGFIDGPQPIPESIVGFSNIPAILIAGWNGPCAHQVSSLDAFFRARFGTATRRAEVLTLICFCILIALQWVLVGGFPLIGSKLRWAEPGTVITVGALSATAVFWVGQLLGSRFDLWDTFCKIPTLIAALAWLAWFVLLAILLIRSVRRFLRRKFTRQPV